LGGYKIVLTSDRTLMSEYGGAIFMGFSACVPKGVIPDWVYFNIFCPSVKVNRSGSPLYASYGLRKVEAALLDYGFGEDEVAVAHSDYIDRFIGDSTRVIGVSENDPLGIGPATTTFTEILGGEAYMAIKFRELLSNQSIAKYRRNIRVIVGGPGAWQLEDGEMRSKLGVDCVVIGEGEKVVGPLFEKAVRGEEIPGVVYGDVVDVDEMPIIRRPAVCGLVEISRGCGRGCAFCVPTMLKFRCRPIDDILAEVRVTVRGGRNPLLHGEDVLRYGAKGIEANPEAVLKLFKSVLSEPGVTGVSISHFTLSTVVATPRLIEELSSLLGLSKNRWISGQTGIETGSPRIMSVHMRGKCKPFRPEDWPDVVVEAFQILSDNNWVPCGTMILGLPGEEPRDVDYSIELVKNLRSFKSLIVPLFFVAAGSLEGKVRSFKLEDLTVKHSELILECWEHNLRWTPILMKEYFRLSSRNRIICNLMSVVIRYGIRRTLKLIDECRRVYGGDIKAMVEAYRMGAKRMYGEAYPIPSTP